MKTKKKVKLFTAMLCIVLFAATYFAARRGNHNFLASTIFPNPTWRIEETNYKLSEGTDYYVLNENKPQFTAEEITRTAFESYGNLDTLGRCTTAFACLGRETLPKDGERRESLYDVKPSGWRQAKYEFLETPMNKHGYLYNRCHLIAWCISDENANEKNLITGTIHLNNTMWAFESLVKSYIHETGNHVMYRVTPVYERDSDMLASYVIMEAWSVEDRGALAFNVMCMNDQEGVAIDYSTGYSRTA